jgi:hypothetical protein
MTTEPTVTPLTTPEEETVALALLAFHVPPPTVVESAIVPVLDTEEGPVIVPGDGVPLAVTT